jgi:hypothetical protein
MNMCAVKVPYRFIDFLGIVICHKCGSIFAMNLTVLVPYFIPLVSDVEIMADIGRTTDAMAFSVNEPLFNDNGSVFRITPYCRFTSVAMDLSIDTPRFFLDDMYYLVV